MQKCYLFRGLKSDAEITPAVSVEIKSKKNNRIELVHQGDALTNKDSYSIEFKSKNYAYVYIYQADSSGKIFDLFPSTTLSSRSNPVKPGELYRLPENIGAWIHLDNNKGKEQIIVMAHMNEIAEPEKICRQVINAPSSPDNVMLASARGPGGIADDGMTSQTQSQPAVSPPSSIKNLFVWKQYFNHR
ncbi:DUF4384 domain-containing protein [Desulfonema limicola]|nr:DUF4384 domain-containing protein [Desulfonema limicola]